ncbi:MAG TPA: cupin domain-containing protein [Nitrososphaeraceae archaeon]|jgi:quercetin dioxygenase-like cupin family protein|nr:cupin domain-containing protein [Nitrososphaeraceae archaeon]
MFEKNIYNSPVKKVDPSYFRGKVILQRVLDDRNSRELEIYHVYFKNGAITTVHYHETDQVLIATKGRGIVGIINSDSIANFEIKDIETVKMNKNGDVVHIPAFKMHFHGAASKQDFSHLAIRQMYFFDSSTKKIRRAENKWESEIILEKVRNPDPSYRGKIADKIRGIIQNAIYDSEVTKAH